MKGKLYSQEYCLGFNNKIYLLLALYVIMTAYLYMKRWSYCWKKLWQN